MSNHTDCQHAIFCPTWANWKCTEHSCRLQNPEGEPCELFAKREGEMPLCQCENCLERGQEDE